MGSVGEVEMGDSSYLWDLMTVNTFQLASDLTDPACEAHKNFRMISVVEDLHPEDSRAMQLARKTLLGAEMVVYAAIAAVTTLPGIALRQLACKMQGRSFLHLEGNALAKAMQENFFTLLSWNICFVGAGFAISDGGVLPWPYRIGEISQKIKAKNADVVCLYELMDFDAAWRLYDLLKDDYAHFYFNIGAIGFGVNSGIFIASKFEVTNPDFVAFPKSTLVGRTKYAEKGVFSFDIPKAHIEATHLQHSEIVSSPTAEEFAGRRAQMEIIVERVKQVKGKSVVVTGDLNLDDYEFLASAWSVLFDKGEIFGKRKTWPGDAYCATLVEKEISHAANLDHTMVLKGTAKKIVTFLIESGYDPLRFLASALTDHDALYTIIPV